VTNAEIAKLLTEALEAKAREQIDNAQLVMLSVEYVAHAMTSGAIEARVARKTRTLLFLEAELRGEDGALIARASSVHAIN
jgi:acyl-coenzyme A thioesterase PaaI-like protein